MVKGLDIFREWFAAFADQYVLIGGTAATLTMEDAGLEFRATKDLDIVLHVEALTPAFGEAFWKFVEAGKYEIRQASETGKPNFYRFIKPGDERFPAMVELFARAPAGLKPAEGSQPLPSRSTKPSPASPPSCWTRPTTPSSWRDAGKPMA